MSPIARRTGIKRKTSKPNILSVKHNRVTAPTESIKIQKNFNIRGNTEPDDELYHSIEEHGVLNPLHVRWKDKKEDTLYIVDGERRYKAAKKAKWSDIPVVCRGHIDDREALIISLSTNEGQLPLKRTEKAEGFRRLRDAGLTEPEIADVMGCSERMVTETLRLVDKAIGPLRKASIGNGKSKTKSKVRAEEVIPKRAASRAATLPDKEQKKLAKMMKGMTTEEALEEVRKVEKRLGITTRGRPAAKSKAGAIPPIKLKELIVTVERRLKRALKTTPGSRTLRAQLDIIAVLKGEKDIAEALPQKRKK